MKKSSSAQSQSSDAFSKRLRTLRSNRRLSMREAARRIGVPESTYRQWEYGQSIQGEPYPKIATVFEVTLDELFGISTSDESVEEQLNKIIEITRSIKSKLS